jgi:transposase
MDSLAVSENPGKEPNMGREVKYVVRLTNEEQRTLGELIASPRIAKAKALRARMLLKADVAGPHWTDVEIADAFAVSQSTVHRLREQFVEEGLEVALRRKPHSRTKPRKLDGEQEAQLVMIACSPAPEGRARWTLQLLADRLVELAVVEEIAPETVRQTLKKTCLNRGKMSNGSFPRKATPTLSAPWKTSSKSTSDRMTPAVR